MNIILFEAEEINNFIPITDRRIEHLLRIVKITENEFFDAGIINKSIGKAKFSFTENKLVKIHYTATDTVPDKTIPIHIILGMIRPVNVQRVVRDLCTLGVTHLHFTQTDKSEKSYAKSKAYLPARLKHYLIEGAEQAFNPFIPQLSFYTGLKEAIVNQDTEQKFGFDNYVHDKNWGQIVLKQSPVLLALGPERGWSNKERDLLQEHNFTLCSLGKRVIRSETAAIVATSICLASLGYM